MYIYIYIYIYIHVHILRYWAASIHCPASKNSVNCELEASKEVVGRARPEGDDFASFGLIPAAAFAPNLKGPRVCDGCSQPDPL